MQTIQDTIEQTVEHTSQDTAAGERTTSGSLVLVTALAPIAWGTTYFVSSEMLPADRPLLAGLLRALPAGIALALATRVRPTGTWWLKAAVLGTLNIGAFFAFLFVAAFRLPGGVAATLGAVQPLIAAGLAASLLGERFSRRTLTSGLLGIAGVGLLVLRSGARLDGLGVAAGLLGATSMAAGIVLTKRWGRPVPLLAFTSWQLIAGGLLLLPLTATIEGIPTTMTGTNIAGFVWLATLGTALAYVVWFRGVQRLPVARVSILGLLSPVTAATIGWIALGQQLSIGQLLGMVIILAAVLLAQRADNRPLPPVPEP
ncbi:MAG: EamA family transporter [Acidimicrobiia bacterium]|nr:EamA family transporter [Acidimicrobiia bacterium]